MGIRKKMKKIIKRIAIVVVVLLVGIFIFRITYIGDGKIDEGTYRIHGYERYKDAYITVKDDTIQFANIDLNSIYRKEQLKQVEEAIKVHSELGESMPQPSENDSDFNYHMVKNAYQIKYCGEDAKTGSFSYTYFCQINRSGFMLVIEYDSLHKTIRVNNSIQPLEFKK